VTIADEFLKHLPIRLKPPASFVTVEWDKVGELSEPIVITDDWLNGDSAFPHIQIVIGNFDLDDFIGEIRI
jgi:hypothetical protein